MNCNLTNKKIGIWGLGVSGQALVNYLLTQTTLPALGILDKKITPETRILFKNYPQVTLYQEDPATIASFLKEHDVIIPSPGIDLRPYKAYSHKFVAELDLFYSLWQKKIIAITGTLGKTSITHLLTTLLRNAGLSVTTGGNIGTGMFDLLSSDAEYALLELSSFQLEQCQHFCPDFGVITNIYPNHLDRHGTMEQYRQAKLKIFAHQKPGQWALVPLELAPILRNDVRFDKKHFAFFAKEHDPELTRHLAPNDNLFGLQTLTTIPTVSYPENWLVLNTILNALGLDAQKLITESKNLDIPDYRLEKVATINDISYYNDSKSTIMQATLAAVDAVQKTHGSNIILLLGGTSKGVDRSPFIHQLKNIRYIVCFGAEAEQLLSMCKQMNIPATHCQTLQEAVACAHKNSGPTTGVVLSPGGASFDLFKDYKDRGEQFKKLVLALQRN